MTAGSTTETTQYPFQLTECDVKLSCVLSSLLHISLFSPEMLVMAVYNQTALDIWGKSSRGWSQWLTSELVYLSFYVFYIHL